MSQLFSFSRFSRLFGRHIAEFLPSYLMSTAVLAGGVLVVLGSLTYITRRPLDRETQIISFMFGMLAAGTVFTSSVFAALGTPRSATPALLLPASHLEKYLVAWCYSLPVFLLVYTAVFSVINALVLQLGNQGYPYEQYDFSRGAREWVSPLLGYVLLHSIALLGAIYFERLHAIKTAFLVFGSLVALLVVNRQVLKALIPGSWPIAPFGDVWVGEQERRVVLSLPDNQWQLVLTLLPLALALLLWRAAYVRLTEKQL